VYRHLLVPIDGTDLSVEVVGNAVALARPLGARITFFHAAADHAASLRGEAEVVRLTSRENYDYAFTGRPRELLAKAEAAARAATSSSWHRTAAAAASAWRTRRRRSTC